MTEHVPGPWFSYSTGKKTRLWLRYEPIQKCKNLLAIGVFAFSCYVRRRPLPFGLKPPYFMKVLWRIDSYHLGRYYTVKWED